MRGMASFLAGMGGGYLKAREKTAQDERQAKQDAWQGELQGRQRSEWQEADNLKSDLKRAAEPVSTGSVVTDAAGSSAFTKDADAATMLADMSSAKNSGTATQNATRVVDSVYTDPAKADEATKLATTPEAQNTRIVDAYKRSGQADKALTMQAAMRQGELGDIQLANTKFQQRIGDWMGSGFDGFRDGLNGYEGGPFKGKKVDFVLSEDGKTRSVVSIGPDGQPKPTGLVVPNSNEGLYQLGYILDKSVMPADRLKMHRDEKKLEIEQQKADAADKKTEAYMQSLLGRASGGGSGGGKAAGGQVAAGGLNMDALDKQLAPLFATEDPTTGAKSVNAQGLMAVRQLALAMPSAARGDATGAALEAYNAYTVALQKAGGDQAKAVTLIQQALRPTPPAASQPGQTQATAEQPGKTVKSPFADDKPAPAAEKPKPVEPKGQIEFKQFQQAIQMGYQPASRGNAVFGQGEILYVNPKTGDRKWASQLFAQ